MSLMINRVRHRIENDENVLMMSDAHTLNMVMKTVSGQNNSITAVSRSRIYLFPLNRRLQSIVSRRIILHDR